MAGEIIIDDFLDDFNSFRAHCDGASYHGEKTPKDGVFYPGVSLDIPESVEKEIVSKVGRSLGKNIKLNVMFLRLTPFGMDAPHGAHTDSVMGDISLMVYMNRVEDCEGGTSLLLHKETGLSADPINEKQENTWKADTNSSKAWQITGICPMVPNRAFIFNASIMHRAEPVGGFGVDAKDARLVLTAFFSYD
jgi:hypothetical protein